MAQNPVGSLQLFGIIAADPGARSPAPDTTLVPFRAIAALVAPAPYQRATLDEERVQAYAQTVEEAYRFAPILPAPPGTIFRSRSALGRWLELHYVTLSDALALVDGSTAARVTIRLREAAKNEETIREWHLVATEIMRTLRGNASALTILETPAADERTVGIASFLIERERWGAFEAGVAAERKRHPSLEFGMTGPWPPYDFVKMQFTS
ncbi:MAG: GvpL/GvpF family gas vesicle protein [Gemmatimonadaceae bacterium]